MKYRQRPLSRTLAATRARLGAYYGRVLWFVQTISGVQYVWHKEVIRESAERCAAGLGT